MPTPLAGAAPDAEPAQPPPVRIHTRALLGLQAHAVTVECHVGAGLPNTTIVGLPEGAVREARDRVRSALHNAGYAYPDGVVVINLAPGGIAKSSTGLDLPIAMAVLAATDQVRTAHLGSFEFLGELSLFGELRSINGALACALASSEAGRQLVIPRAAQTEASVAPAGAIVLAETLSSVVQAMNEERPALPEPERACSQNQPKAVHGGGALAQVVGQQAAKRALIVAAAGAHHLLMVGPPGTGKTMLARGFAQLLPPLDERSRLEVAAIYSAAGLSRADYAAVPFRDPHHSASAPALVGGGNPPMPGEVALAHHGVLFLDELPHFKPSALNLLREPIESGEAVIARARYKVTFPCRFQLIAAMNPCPAGRTCSEDACRCTPAQVQRYQSRISGPMLDRIDIHVHVPVLPQAVLSKLEKHPPDTSVAGQAEQIAAARARQQVRQKCANAMLSGDALRPHMAAAEIDRAFLEQAIERYRLSARSYHKIWRIARTIADLDDADVISAGHMAEALSYRVLDWESGVS